MSDTGEMIETLRDRAGTIRGLGYRVRFDLTDRDESALLDGTGPGGATLVAVEADAEADAVLALSTADLARLMAGKLSPMLAFATGRLKVSGSKGVALKLASLLDET